MDNKKLQIPEPRAMTREEVKKFRASGFDPVFMDHEKKVSPIRLTAEMNDWILDNVYQGYTLDTIPCDKLNDLCHSTFRKTYGLQIPENDETKNS